VIDAVDIVVPARDEERLLPACLASLREAAGHPALRGRAVRIAVVLDDCSDRSGELALAAVSDWPGAVVLDGRYRAAGAARAAGVERLVASGGRDPARLWIASTDADTRVPADWLVRQLAHADAGADAVAGIVEVDDWREQPEAVRRRFAARYAALRHGTAHAHVHGANLGARASALLAAGGVPLLPLAEDHALVEGLRAVGARVVSSADVRVVTSARREGRAPGGFSDLLRGLGQPAADTPAVRPTHRGA
jgi:hypothetical protein